MSAKPAANSDTFRTSKADQVYEDIKEAILSGALEPGAAIDKVELCGRLGVSRFPVTTAINRLAFERLVVIEPQHGSFVARISAQDVHDLMILRRAIEIEIAAEAAHRLPRTAHELLDRNLRYQQAAVEAKDYSGFYTLDVEFHQIIIGGAGVAHASDILIGLRSHLERVRRLLLPAPGRLPKTFDEHKAMAAAVKAGDAAKSRDATRYHLEQSTAHLADFAREHPNLFNLEPVPSS